MKRRLFRNFPLVTLITAASLLGLAVPAAAAGPVEGGFEAGLAAWAKTSFYGNTEWASQTKAETEAEFGFEVPAAVGTNVAATKYGGPDTALLAQTFALPAASELELSLYLFYKSASPTALPTPNTLFVRDEEPGANQQVRVDVLKSNAPLESVSPNDILATLYASPEGGPTELRPTLLKADLTPFAGQDVTLRIAEATSDGELQVGVGAVSLAATPIPAPPLPAPEAPASTPISDGVASPVARKLVHHLAGGSAQLIVGLPAAGTLVVSDARRKAAVASSFAARSTGAAPKPVLIRTASAHLNRVGIAHLPLRPTAAAQRLLNHTGRAPFRLQLTFTSTLGAVSTATYRGVLLKRLPRASRPGRG